MQQGGLSLEAVAIWTSCPDDLMDMWWVFLFPLWCQRSQFKFRPNHRVPARILDQLVSSHESFKIWLHSATTNRHCTNPCCILPCSICICCKWQDGKTNRCLHPTFFLDSDKLLHIEKLSLAVFHLQNNFVKTDFWMEPVMVRITFLSVKVRKEVGGPETQKRWECCLWKNWPH